MRKSIPKTLKNKVWDTYIGREKGIGNCFCCNKEIDSKNFDCGHIISVKQGGPTTLENMRPLCSTCNKSMGEKNMEQFKNKYFPENDNLLTKLIEVNTATFKNFFTEKFYSLWK